MPRFLPLLLLGCVLVAWFVAGEGRGTLSGGQPLAEMARGTSNSSRGAAGESAAASTRMEVRSAPDGHFYLTLAVNGTPIRFLVDTGATAVALTPADAERAGIASGRLRFDREVMTAAGRLAVADVTLREMRLDQRRVYDVDAVVLRRETGISLLGMSFLGALEGYEVRKGRLILHL